MAAAAFSACGPRLPFRVDVPSEFQQDPPGWSRPNGEPERVRYANAYEAFWWNCTILKSQDLEARCPAICSGTPGAAAGCGAGGTDSSNAIAALVKEHGSARTKQLLEARVRDADGFSRIKRYFVNGPQAEIVR